MMLQGLQHCSEEMRTDARSVIAMWQYEATRVYLDRVCRTVDHKWIEETIHLVSAKVQLSRTCMYLLCLSVIESLMICSISHVPI